MLLWQHKKMLKIQYCLQLSAVVILLHAVVLVLILLQSNIGYDELEVIASTSYDLGADVIVVPFSNIKPEEVITTEQKQPSIKKATTLVQAPKQKAPKKIPSKLEAKLKVKKVEPQIEKPQVVEKKSDESKVSEKAEGVEQTQKQEVKSALEKKEPFRSGNSKPSAQKLQKQISTKELKSLNIQQAIAQQVNLHWQPPEGFADDLQAIITIALNYKGEVDAIDMKEGSGVLAYDIHARSAIYAMQFPRACWGKKITITFKQ